MMSKEKKRNTKKRGNGTGSVYRGPHGTWIAQKTVGWTIPEDLTKNVYPVKRKKGGFKTKAEAEAYLPFLARTEEPEDPTPTLQEVFEEWEKGYSARIRPTTMAVYKAAYKHFGALSDMPIDEIRAKDLQEQMDACRAGKRTRQVMRVIAGLLWGYAFDCEYVDKDITQNLFTGKGKSESREPISEADLEIIRQAIGSEPYAEYIYCQCYLGYRPGELLGLKKDDLRQDNDGTYYFIAGIKTEAGKDRAVPVPHQITDIILKRLHTDGTDLIFPMVKHNRKGEFTGYKQMTTNYYCDSVFKPLCKKLGLSDNLVPYSARHTYADKLKHADGDDRDKAALMGHTDYDFTRKQYQTTQLDDLTKVTNSIK